MVNPLYLQGTRVKVNDGKYKKQIIGLRTTGQWLLISSMGLYGKVGERKNKGIS